MIGLTALDITCPTCLMPRDEYCFPARAGKTRFHQTRIDTAVAITKAANKKERENAAQG